MGNKKKHIPVSKLSKKQRLALAKQQRVTWEFSPVTRKAEHPKAYRRSKQKQFRDFDFPPNCFFISTFFYIPAAFPPALCLHFAFLWGIIRDNLPFLFFCCRRHLMKISQLLAQKKPMLSFEVFPPKSNARYSSTMEAAQEIALLKPPFMSVTYGAAGGTRAYTASLAAELQRKMGVPTLAHLTCVGSDLASLQEQLSLLQESGIQNIMALRGDVTDAAPPREQWAFQHANELMHHIRSHYDFCIGGACYPEVHPESENQAEDIASLRLKQEAGCDFLTTQMFFDNNIFYNFLDKIREAGVTIPVIPGIMPITNAAQIKRSVSLSGTQLPRRFVQIADYFGSSPKAMRQAGIAYATEQIIDLFANGISIVHIYSMNQPEVARRIQANLSDILA